MILSRDRADVPRDQWSCDKIFSVIASLEGDIPPEKRCTKKVVGGETWFNCNFVTPNRGKGISPVLTFNDSKTNKGFCDTKQHGSGGYEIICNFSDNLCKQKGGYTALRVEEKESSSKMMWVTLAILVVIMLGIAFYMYRQRR